MPSPKGTKSGGTIYGQNEGANTNTASAVGQGHAAYADDGGKYRDTTAGEGVNLDSGTPDNWGMQ